jgi:hypothetical protein
MLELPKNIVIMKVGPHSNMLLDEIIKSKQEEERLHGVHYWGYSGVFCKPKPTQEFCNKCMWGTNIAPSLVLLETKSPYQSSIGLIKKYSSNGSDYFEFKNPVQLQGAEYSFVTKNLRIVESFPLNAYNVISGKNNRKPLLEHLRFRINKSFATLCIDESRLQLPKQIVTVLMADFAEPFAIWLKD